MNHSVSVRRITWKYLSVLLTVSLIGLLLIVRFGWLAIEEDMQRHHQFETSLLQRQFSDVFGFYQGIAVQLSRRTEVADMLEFGDKGQAVNWARDVRRLIPESIGVALIDSEGTILGEPLQLSVGEQCVSDLQQLFAGQPVGSPPVHRGNPKLAHFDITQEVVRDGEVLGVLFISFSLNVLQHRADQLIGPGQTLVIEDSDGERVVQLGVDQHHHHSGEGHPMVAIDNTDWTLHYMSDEYGANALFVTTLLIVLAILIATIIAMVVLSLKLVTLFQKELGLIKEQLEGVYAGDRETVYRGRTVLSETREIMGDVWQMMGNIEQANSHLKALTINDELSGLLNRRGFNDQLEQAWELSARGVTASLLLLDLDHFKQVNDGFGHGTGDEVIVALAQALRVRCRKSDIIARLGGDEFAVILNSVTQQASVEQWYHQLAEYFARLQLPLFPGDASTRCTISAGAVLLDKGRYDWLQKQLEGADRALYKAKGAGRGRIACDFPTIRLSS